jgi:hypothetical protein
VSTFADVKVRAKLTDYSYFYGGLDEFGEGLVEAYTLSIPSFQWVLVRGQVPSLVRGSGS